MAGFVLLSALIISGMHGLRLHKEKIRINQHRIEATVIAEKLLANWSLKPDIGVPVGVVGVIDPQRQWYWRTQMTGMRSVFGQPVMIVALEIFENLPQPNAILVSIELMKALPPPANATGPGGVTPPESVEREEPES